MVLKLCQVPDEITEIHPLVVYTREAAQLIKVSSVTMRELVKDGTIPARVRGDRLLILVSDLQDYLESLPDYKPGDSIVPRSLR
jgi:excisionase family DNA binding protein